MSWSTLIVSGIVAVAGYAFAIKQFLAHVINPLSQQIWHEVYNFMVTIPGGFAFSPADSAKVADAIAKVPEMAVLFMIIVILYSAAMFVLNYRH